MAGFLTRIAVRLGGPEGQLRPRPRSLFEPVAPTAPGLVSGGAPAESSPLENAVERADQVEIPAMRAPQKAASPPRNRRTGVAPDPAGPDRDAPPPPERVAGPPGPRTAPPTHRRWPAGTEAAVEPIAGAEATPDTPAPQPGEPARETRPTEIAVRPRTTRPDDRAMAAEAVERIDERPARRDAAPAAARRSGTAASAQDDREERPATAWPAPPATGILQAPAVAHIAAAPLPPPARAQRSEPAIQVTIGRVEVRATAAPPSDSARPERPSPVMGLDEYLRMRAR